MARGAKIDYDVDNDILWVHSGKKVKESLEVDKFVLDFSDKNKINGIEIQNASEVISELSSTKITKEALSKILSARIRTYMSKDLLYSIVLLVIPIGKEAVEIPVTIGSPKKAIMMARN